MHYQSVLGKAWQRDAVAVLLVAAAVGGRLAFLGALENRNVYLTFYPALILAALYGGLRSGLVAAFLSTLAASWFFIEPTGNPFVIRDTADLLGLTIFFVNGVAIAAICHAMHRAQERMRHAQLQAATLEEQRRGEAALRASDAETRRQKELLAVTLASIGDAVIVTDTQSRVIFLNGEAQRLTGWTPAEAQSRPLPEVFHIINQETRAPVENPTEKVLRLGITAGLANHTVLIAKDGRETPIDDSGAPVRSDDGAVHGVVLVFRDISHRKKWEDELASVAQFPLENPNPVMRLAADGSVLFANDPGMALLVELGHQKGRTAPEWFAVGVAETLAAERKIQREIVCARGRAISFDFHPVPGRNYVNLYGRDVTDARRAEAALRASDAETRRQKELLAVTLASIGDAVIVTDTQSRVTFLNAEARRLTGWNSEDAHGRPLPEIFHIINEETRAPAENPAEKVLRLGITVGLANHTVLIAKDGRETPIDDSGAPVRSDDGAVHGVVLVFRDITQRRAAEEALRLALAAAQEASGAKDHFLAVLSHELRTPLNAVIPALEKLAPSVSGEGSELLEMARRNILLEARLIDDLLDVTRIARGKIEVEQQPVELCRVIRLAAEVCAPDIEARGLQFDIRIDGPDCCIVNGDPARLQQVFWNLIKNSIKFTPPGGRVTISVRSRHPQTSAQPWALVQVTDSGLGIEPDHLPLLFNAFEQAERAITRQFGGLGLGLAICKTLVELHGGTIHAQSDGRDKGATFTVELPLMETPRQQHEPPSGQQPDVPSMKPAPLRILLVEDHGDTARVMHRILHAEGHHVEHAADVTTALDLAASDNFDLLISDLGLPDASGHDLIRQIRALGKSLKAIAISGYGMPADVQQSRDAGFDEHITKPVDIQRLLSSIARVSSRPTPT